ENRVDAAIEQRADLVLEEPLAIVRIADAERSDAARDANVMAFGGGFGDLRGGPIEFAHAALVPKLREPRGVRAKAVRFNEARTGGDVFLVNALHGVRPC